jgi:GT2 family glycosyltransferase
VLKPKEFTAIIPVIRTDMVERCVETLYKYTDNIFYCYIIDQTIEGLDANKLRDKYPNLMVIRAPKTDLHSTGNLGFQQAIDLGVRLVDTPYTLVLNDDVEFISNRWFAGIMDTFLKVTKATPTRPPLLVNAASIKLPDWSVGKPKGEDHYILPYKDTYTDEDWDFLVNEDHFVNEHLTITVGSVVDGINLYASMIDTKKLLEVGSLDHLWYPGSAGDYDLSCLASMFGYRCVSTTLSWVFHHWSKTFEDEEHMQLLVQDELKHLDLRDKWGDRFDLWGVRCTQKGCEEIMHTDDGIKATCPKHPEEVYAIPENTIAPL